MRTTVTLVPHRQVNSRAATWNMGGQGISRTWLETEVGYVGIQDLTVSPSLRFRMVLAGSHDRGLTRPHVWFARVVPVRVRCGDALPGSAGRVLPSAVQRTL